MLAKRLVVFVASLWVAFAAGETAQAAAYPLAKAGGSGLQFHIGGGLPLPIQPTSTMTTGTVFPALLVEPVGGTATPTGFLLQTSGPDPKAITIVYPLLSHPPAYKKLGVFKNNPLLYQVATKLSVEFPVTSQSAAMFELATSMDPPTVGRTGATTTTFTTPVVGNSITYSNALAQRFGGPARFFAGNPGTKPIGGLYAGVNATIWALAVPGPGAPPCAGPPFCLALLAQAVPETMGFGAAWGASVGFVVSTAGGTPGALATSPGSPMTAKPKQGPEPGLQLVSAPTSLGSIAMSAFTAMAPAAITGITNMASSTGYPWTTGMITVMAPMAVGGPETFVLSGMDLRVGGVGVIQLVSGSLSRRTVTGPNANRAWLRLNVPEPSATLGAAASLAMLALCHGLARGRSR